MKNFTAIALNGFPLVKSGDNIAEAIVETMRKNNVALNDEDVIVVAQKVVSKAEERVANVKEIVPSKRAGKIAKIVGKGAKFVELVLSETKRLVKASKEILLVEDKRGLICINAGIDKSNVEGRDYFALLPEDPDASAQKCRREIRRLTGKNVAVIISDTYSRPFRRAQVNFAIGVAGLEIFRDYRGKKDLFGNVLKVKCVAVVDELAAAAEILMGQGKEATPIVIFKGLKGILQFSETSSIGDLRISAKEDLFRKAL